jgi:hypothetical protein
MDNYTLKSQRFGNYQLGINSAIEAMANNKLSMKQRLKTPHIA